MTADNIGDTQREYEPCIVSFIDVLGFRHILETRTANEVYQVLEYLRRYTSPIEDEAGEDLIEARRQSRAFSFSVSDAIVRARPYGTRYRDGAFVAELSDLIHAQLYLLSLGVFVRAGVAIGDAYVGLTGEGPVFGPAMVRAYEIESSEAIYPRIVIDAAAVTQHDADPMLWARHRDGKCERDYVNSLLSVDRDGKYFLDYLRFSIDAFDGLNTHIPFLNYHRDLIRHELNENSDERVLEKFEWLRNYHNGWIENLAEYEHLLVPVRDSK